jgi:hypothetical protein
MPVEGFWSFLVVFGRFWSILVSFSLFLMPRECFGGILELFWSVLEAFWEGSRRCFEA